MGDQKIGRKRRQRKQGIVGRDRWKWITQTVAQKSKDWMIRKLEEIGASGNDELWAETDDNGSESATLWGDGNITRGYDELWAVPPEGTIIRGKCHQKERLIETSVPRRDNGWPFRGTMDATHGCRLPSTGEATDQNDEIWRNCLDCQQFLKS